jgi:hypothetical protein
MRALCRVDVRLGARSSASMGFLSSGRMRSTAIVIEVLRDCTKLDCACVGIVCDGPRRDARSVCFGAVVWPRIAGAFARCAL